MNSRPTIGSRYYGNVESIATAARSQGLQMRPLNDGQSYRCYICREHIDNPGNASAMLEVGDGKGVTQYPIHIGCLNEKIREQTLESN